MAEHHISTSLDDPLATVHADLETHRMGLAGLLREAEALRDEPSLLATALNRLLADDAGLRSVAEASSVHPNGFAKVVLHGGDEYGVRLHVWKKNAGLWVADSQPHGHRWMFASWIVAGTLRETVFLDGGNLPYDRYDYRRDADGPHLDLVPEQAVLQEDRTVDRRGGEVYGREVSTLHTVTPVSEELVASLVLQGPHDGDRTPVFVPAGRRPNDDEERLSVDRLRALLADVVAVIR